MQCSGATGACRRGGRAAGSAAAAAATSITAAWHPQQHPATQRPYEWLRRPLSLRCGAGPFGVPCLRPPGPRSGGSCVLSSASTGFAGASQSAASACFASAAAAVPIAVAAGSRAAVAAAARQTGALAASGAAATEEMQQVDVGGGLVRGVKGRGPEGRSDNPASLPEGGTAEGTASGVVLQQDEQQQQQQHGTTAGPLKGGVPLGAAFWGAGAVGCTIWALAYMRQHNMSFTDFAKDLWRRADAQMTATHDRMQCAVEDLISHAFPEDEEPLLPDFKDLNYPEFLPTLVLDFDGVLAKIGHDRTGGYKLRKRPYSEALVNQLSHFFEVVVWNADQPPVVQTALQQWGLPVTACLNSDNMSRRHGRKIKDFSRLGRRLDRLIYVSCTDEGLDDRFRANFIRVSPFEGTAEEMLGDTELGDLLNFLKHCSLSPEDVRLSIARYGGGEDGGVGRRYDAAKKAQETKASQRRNIGKLFGISSSQGQAGAQGFLPPPQQSAALGGKAGPFGSGALR